MKPNKSVANRDKHGKNTIGRDKKGLWLPGQSPNPAGRPPKGDAWADIYNEILDSKKIKLEITKIDEKESSTKKIHLTSKTTMRYALGIALLKEGLKGNVTAVRELSDRTVGKPPQSIAIKGEEDIDEAFQNLAKGLRINNTSAPSSRPDTAAD